MVLYRNIARLGALERLVLIDACQAEAIADDSGVRQIQSLVDSGAHRARTAYLLAARRGEAAGESGVLEHGLLTYALLKGLVAAGLKQVPGFALLRGSSERRSQPRSRGHDRGAALVRRRDGPRPGGPSPQPRVAPSADGLAAPLGTSGAPVPAPRLQAADTSFPLVELPDAGSGSTTIIMP